MKVSTGISGQLKNLPQKPGVYLFKNKNGRILYIGKAINIRKRVISHFSRPSFRQRHFDFLKDVKKIDYKLTDSEIEALLLEAALIRKHWPHHNVMWRDDKNYFYVAITNEKYPRVFITHQLKNVSRISYLVSGVKSPMSKIQNTNVRYIGPFVDGKALKITLRVLRRIFPYRTCGKIPHRTCMWFDIHKKEVPCGGKMNPKEYRKLIENLTKFLEAKKENVLASLKKEMKQFSKKEDFEKAAHIRDRIKALESILANAQIFLGRETITPSIALGELKQILHLVKPPHRIEGYDISNIQGKEATGSMVVFIEGEPAKEHYRKFKIRTKDTPNDVAMLKEMIARRLTHQEWPYPDLMLIDGGRGQLNSARAALGLHGYKKQFAIAALAKRQNLLYLETQKDPIPMKNIPGAAQNLLTHIRDEAHRFAISYHRKLHRKKFAEE